MPIAKAAPPKRSLAKLRNALTQLAPLKEHRKHWMQIHPGTIRPSHIVRAQPIYSVRLIELLERHSLAATLRRTGWMYFIQNPRTRIACAEVSIVAGKHANFRLTEGPFVRNTLRAIHKAQKDPRLRGHSFALRFLRAESLHLFVLWLRASAQSEFWILVTPIGDTVASMKWLTRKNFVDLLVNEAKRVTASRDRAMQFAKRV
jgi:hypothetical protein